MSEKVRIDELLVTLGLAPSRSRARAMVMAGVVVAGEHRVDKPGQRFDPSTPVRLKGEQNPYVSRGGLKLAHGLEAFSVDPTGRRCLDLGASTGGFTDCLLQHGAAEVVAVDVGYGQLHNRLRQDERVVVMERTNARHLSLEDLGEPASLVVADCSFIGLELILPAAVACMAESAELIALVKPQFQVGREAVGKGGVVRDPELHAQAVADVTAACEALGLTVDPAVASPITGPKGNVEFLLHARRGPADG